MHFGYQLAYHDDFLSSKAMHIPMMISSIGLDRRPCGSSSVAFTSTIKHVAFLLFSTLALLKSINMTMINVKLIYSICFR